MEYRYNLEVGSKKHRCPSCNKTSFKRYIDNDDDTYISDKVGRCDRESKCGYMYSPKQFFNDNNINVEYKPIERTLEPLKETSYIDNDILKASLNNDNKFMVYLRSIFNNDIAIELADKYKIGSSKYWNGASVFWQLDKLNRVRSGKVMLYDEVTGKRVKEPFNHINWVHSILHGEEYNLKQCLFGEHLIKDSSKPIAIVESEKTAIISSVYFDEFTWVATGGLSNLNYNTINTLINKDVRLYPDSGCYDKWKSKADDIKLDCTISKSIEHLNDGSDIADYLVEN